MNVQELIVDHNFSTTITVKIAYFKLMANYSDEHNSVIWRPLDWSLLLSSDFAECSIIDIRAYILQNNNGINQVVSFGVPLLG